MTCEKHKLKIPWLTPFYKEECTCIYALDDNLRILILDPENVRDIRMQTLRIFFIGERAWNICEALLKKTELEFLKSLWGLGTEEE